MSGELTPRSALENVAGWEEAHIEKLYGGFNNQTYKVTVDGRSAVLKLDSVPRRAPFNTRAVEALIQNSAADAGIAARVLYCSESIYLTEFLAGEVWSGEDLGIPGNLEIVASTLRRLHDLPLTGRGFDAVEASRQYAKVSSRQSRGLTDYCEATIANTPRTPTLRCCHNDLVAGNMLSMPALKFLDWEYACDNDPLFDLATVAEHHQLSSKQTMTLLDSYFLGDGEVWLDPFNDQRRLYGALLWLWMAAQPDRDQDELERVAIRLKQR
ncbi:MAG: phosphotransferase family protein [Gammaproteobacteria bacterium]|nr:phosphotransferase family protein [Gammaproteobacteria bacterium]